jgi:hypothetical protein
MYVSCNWLLQLTGVSWYVHGNADIQQQQAKRQRLQRAAAGAEDAEPLAYRVVGASRVVWRHAVWRPLC